MPLYAQGFIVFDFLATALRCHKTNNPTRIPHLLELRLCATETQVPALTEYFPSPQFPNITKAPASYSYLASQPIPTERAFPQDIRRI